jgi:ribosome maturation factor RimP
MNKKEVVGKVRDIVANLLDDNKIELVDATYRRETGGMTLRLLVDKEGGITLNECAELNGKISELLDGAGVMEDKYLLEVNSPGLDRPLKTRRDFERIMGKVVHVHTYEPVNDKRDHEGEVKAVDDEKVIIGDTEIGLEKISNAKLKLEF